MAFCSNCGAALPAGPSGPAAFCPSCGAPQAAYAPAGVVPYHGMGGDGIPRSFAVSVRICLDKYATFKGRAPRAEFWYFILFNILLGLAAGFLDGLVRVITRDWDWGLFDTIVSLALLLPSIAVQVRRLHDIDRSGWWYWLFLIPLIGWIILLVWDCTRGTQGPNRFGSENGLAGEQSSSSPRNLPYPPLQS